MPPTPEDDEQGDAIVVKGEQVWTRPSSPSSTSSQVDPLVANLLGQTSTPRDLESPEPDPPEDEKMTSQPEHSIGQLPASYERPAYLNQIQPRNPNGLTMEERLQMMPEKREMPWRPGIEPGSEHETGGESRRKQIRFGCLLATRGDVMTAPCNSCANGRGKFSVCVALEGFFKGACASCQLSGRPNRCSIKIDDDGKSQELQSPGLAPTPEAGTSGPSSTAPEQRIVAPGIVPSPRPTLSEPVTSNHALPLPEARMPINVITQVSSHSPGGPPQMKRKRMDEGPPQWDTDRPQWQQELGISQARQQMGLHGMQRPWQAMSKPFPAPISGQLPPHMMNNGANRMRNPQQPPFNRGSPRGWATVNQPPILTSGPPSNPIPLDTNGGGSRGQQHMEQGKREEIDREEHNPNSLIDTLPKYKQRHIYGLVSGLQGGIDHLQRELDLLKKAIGIDDA